ncbi:putative FMN-binding domain-containing protein [Aspergillus pseudonomiae]|uniref:Putative FMN-binding domain-containing protein n=1 Tax=Aspergillus pseudonomiae TaxID=1506151 RepID=A0A5N7DB73_9EURO|nr:putative FMN-binding domain-containing protein [Aspergillus pseudonomiae]KAE8403631.1 putative FMN-binding domain-containing protein [Aspergillus pseudonomiae]
MFLPSVHAESDTDVLFQFIQENPLGILITGINSSTQDFLQCTHVPFVLDIPGTGDNISATPQLRAHIAKQNPQAKAMIEAVDGKPPGVLSLDQDVLVVFNGQHDHYVTPKYYTETKPDTGKVVPTWNYSAVQVYGKLSLYYDSKTLEAGSFLAKQMHDLSEQCERTIMGFTGGDRPQPWKVADAPERYIELMQRNVVGIKIEIGKLEGKFKMSQEMRRGDRDGVVRGFAKLGGETGEAISSLVKERGELHDKKKEELKAAKEG